MDISSVHSDPYPLGSSDMAETCSVPTQSADEAVMLASSQPKKRAGRKKFKETRHPVYRGIRRRNGDRWVCELRDPKNQARIWLGTYPTAEMAARAHDVAALALKGKSACLNFADSKWRLPVPDSRDSNDIRRAAVEAAQAFRPQECYSCDDEESSAGGDQPKQECEKTSTCDLGCGSGQCSSTGEQGEKTLAEAEGSVCYVDEEAIFDMPGLLVNMAEGLLMAPPPCSFVHVDDMESDAEVSLWNYSL